VYKQTRVRFFCASELDKQKRSNFDILSDVNFSLFLLFSRPQKKDVSSHKKHTRLWQKFLSLSLSFYLWDRARARRTGGEDEEERGSLLFRRRRRRRRPRHR
jgi:hypothetical protein